MSPAVAPRGSTRSATSPSGWPPTRPPPTDGRQVPLGGHAAEVVQSGFWVREATEPDQTAADPVRARRPDPDGPVLTIGSPGHAVTAAHLDAADRLLTQLTPQARAGIRLRLAGTHDDATGAAVRNLAYRYRSTRAGETTPAARTAGPRRHHGPTDIWTPPSPTGPAVNPTVLAVGAGQIKGPSYIGR